MRNESLKSSINYCYMYEGIVENPTVFTEITDKMYSYQKIDSTFAALGKIIGDDYNVSDRAFDALNEIYCKLNCEDQTLRTFRRTLGLGQYVQNDLIPFLINVKDPKLIDMMIRILLNLTMPVDCLFSTKVMMRTEIGRQTVFDLTTLLTSCKESFTDARATRAVVEHMKNVFDKGNKLLFEQCDSINNCLLLLRNILHIPETIDSNPNERKNHLVSMQNKIIWHLFMMSIDKLLLFLMSCAQRDFWSVSMVQLICVMYKDQQAETLQKLLNVWLEDALSDSSDDSESNTTPPQKENSGKSSPDLTSDPTSDSSDNGKKADKSCEATRRSQADVKGVQAALHLQSQQNANQYVNTDESATLTLTENEFNDETKRTEDSTDKEAWTQESDTSKTSLTSEENNKKSEKNENGEKRKQFPSTPDQSDCGYGTNSITSSEDRSNQSFHQKPQRFHVAKKPCKVLSAQEQKDRRRKKLVKRGRSSLINMKGLVHHTPTDEDISNLLKEFTVDFLLKGYGYLMQDLHAKLLSNSELQCHIDLSHFFWLVTYFLKFAAQLELDLEHIKCVLSYKLLSYLTFEGITLYEQLELTSRHCEIDLEPCLRRIYLVVTAIREFLQTLNTYTNIVHLSPNDIEYIRHLQSQIGITDDLKQLFILLIRNYNPAIQSKAYLQDLIVTNHILLLIPDSMEEKSADQNAKTELKEHIQQFATVEMMQQYGILLESFLENGEFVNDCILTMMYHVGGELGKATALFQPIILKSYSKIWETEYELCDDWSDLIFYVMTKFISTPQKPPLNLIAPAMITCNRSEQQNERSLGYDVWSKEENDVLYWYYEQSRPYPDPIGQVVKRFIDGNFKSKCRIDVIQQLIQQDIINRSEFNALMKYENMEFERNFQLKPCNEPKKSADEPKKLASNSAKADGKSEETHDDAIEILKERLIRENKEKHIFWLQRILIEYCFAKLCSLKHQEIARRPDQVTVIEPVPYHCILKKQSVPVVPWNAEQSSILSYEPFILLCHQLGLHLPADTGKLFVRVPEFWTADILFNVAQRLGPIDKDTLKFDVNALKIKPTQFAMHTAINGDKNDKNPDVFFTNSDLNFALPTNILNTSSILNRQINAMRSNGRNATSTTTGHSGFSYPERFCQERFSSPERFPYPERIYSPERFSCPGRLYCLEPPIAYNPDISMSISISNASNTISIVQSSKVSVSSDCTKVSDSMQMDIDTDSSSVNIKAGTSLGLSNDHCNNKTRVNGQDVN